VIKTCQGQGKLEATGLEANTKEKGGIAEKLGVPNEEAAVETTRALEDRFGDRRLAVRQSIYSKSAKVKLSL
jgi:hypothetical protein